MPFHIVLRNSNTSGSVPSLRSLVKGELAINTYNGRIYLKKVVGKTERLVSIGGVDVDTGGSGSNYLLLLDNSGSITSSIVYQSGSFIGLGKTSSLNSILDVSGSVTITGSLNINGNTGLNVSGNTVFSGSSNIFLGNVNINGNVNIALPPSILTASFLTGSPGFPGYDGLENRILVDCSTNKFFAWTASLTTLNYAYTASYLSSSTNNFGAGTSGVLTLPTGGQKGDVYLAGVGSDGGGSTGGDNIYPFFPSNWTVISNLSSSLGGEYATTAYLIQTSSVVPSDPTILSMSLASCGFCILLRNVDHNNVTASFSSSVVTGTTGMPDPSVVSASRANSLVVAIGYLDDDSVGGVTAPTNFTMSAQVSASGLTGQTVMVATAGTSSAIVNPGTFGGAGTDEYVAVSLAFFPPSGSITLPTDVAFTNFPLSQSYEMTHVVYTQNTGSLFWTSSLNSYAVTWPYNRIPSASLSQSSVYRFTTIDGGTNIYGQDLTRDSSSFVASSSYALTASTTATVGAVGNTITTSEGTSTTTYTDLATVGPTASVIIGPSGRAMVTLTGVLSSNTAGAQAYMGFSASGAVASDSSSISTASGSLTNVRYQQSATFWVTGLTTGSNTFTAKYKATPLTTTATFANRQIIVVPV